MGKIVLYTNVKGGVGKTTLCGVFATNLANIGRNVAVVDADLQQSLFRHRKRDL
jgi:chromosome partitioning protein